MFMKNTLIILFLFINTAIGATTYYIDPTGNNSNNGSSSSPWNTLSYACSKATLSGDIIHVNAGTYTETSQCVLAVGVSIEGVGATSVIKSHYAGGSDLNSALIMLSGGSNSGQHISGIKMDGDALTGDKAIVVYNRSNVSIYNCTIINFLTQGVRFSGSTNNTGNSIYNNTITNCGGYDSDEHANLSLSYNTGIQVYSNTIAQDKRSSGGTGLGIQGEDYLYAAKIYNNNIRGTERNVSGNWTFAIEFWNNQKLCGYGLEIYGNTIVGEVDFGAGITKGSYSYGVDFHNNTIGYEVSDIPSDLNTGRNALQFEENVSDVIIRNNLFKNIDRQVYFCSNGTAGQFDNVKVYNNIFQNVYFSYSCQPTSGGYSAHGAGILFGGAAFTYARNIYIWNNDFIALPGRAAEIGVFLPTSGDCDNVYIQNNIFQGFSLAPITADLQNGGGTLTTLDIRKNIYYNNASNAFKTVNYSPTNVTNDGGIVSNPLFVSSTDFHLQAGSPAIGKGLPVSGLTTDYAGVAVKNPPSIGAYESGSAAPAPISPVYQSSVVQNTTPSLIEMTYDLTLNNTIVPAVSSFSVLVNSIARTISTVAISGNKVQLALASRILPGDVVTVIYTKPATNPIQTASSGTASSFSNQQVINNCINTIPTAVITSPQTNSSFSTSAAITITASALDTDGSVTLVEFYSGTTKLGSKSSAPYTFTWNNVTAGNYSLTVIATDNLNSKTTSPSVSISVVDAAPTSNQPPIVKILNPSKGIKLVDITSVNIDAIASDPDGSVSKVEFYNGTVKLVELTSAPYTYTWKDVAAGNYSITAIATDNLNDTTVSAPVEFVVGAKVKYDANSDIIKLYPNPNNGHFSIEFINPLQNDKSEIIITDLAGKQVYNGPVLKEETLKQIDVSNSKTGIYVMMIIDKDILVTKKFIKN